MVGVGTQWIVLYLYAGLAACGMPLCMALGNDTPENKRSYLVAAGFMGALWLLGAVIVFCLY